MNNNIILTQKQSHYLHQKNHYKCCYYLFNGIFHYEHIFELQNSKFFRAQAVTFENRNELGQLEHQQCVSVDTLFETSWSHAMSYHIFTCPCLTSVSKFCHVEAIRNEWSQHTPADQRRYFNIYISSVFLFDYLTVYIQTSTLMSNSQSWIFCTNRNWIYITIVLWMVIIKY